MMFVCSSPATESSRALITVIGTTREWTLAYRTTTCSQDDICAFAEKYVQLVGKHDHRAADLLTVIEDKF
jgi:hypothetical protein